MLWPQRAHHAKHTEEAIRNAILDYLDANTGGMDTVDGIKEWWLPAELSGVDEQVVRRVLERMTLEGPLESVDAAGQRYYRLAH